MIQVYGEYQIQINSKKYLWSTIRQQKSAINHLPYSDIPHCISYADQQAAIRDSETEARFLHADNQYFLLLSTPLRGTDRPLWLVSSYDVTSLFRERDRQLRQHLLFQAAAMLLTGPRPRWSPG